MTTSPYAIGLDALVGAARVPAERQVTEQAVPRHEHLPGNPVLWGLPLGAGGSADGGGAGGCDGGGGDC